MDVGLTNELVDVSLSDRLAHVGPSDGLTDGLAYVGHVMDLRMDSQMRDYR